MRPSSLLVVIKHVPGDGSCFYHSIASHLNRVSSVQLREKVVQVYEKVAHGNNRKLAERYYSLLMYYASEQNQSIRRYIKNTHRCMWAGPLEAQVLSDLLKRRIVVLNMDDVKRKRMDSIKCVYDVANVTPLLDFGDKRKRPLLVAISGYSPTKGKFGNHYQPLKRVKILT